MAEEPDTRWQRLFGELRAGRADHELEELRASARSLADEPRGLVIATVVGALAFFVWVGVGVRSHFAGRSLPTIYWLPLGILVPVGIVIEASSYVPGQDFSAQPWDERGREFVNLFRWSTGANRFWGVWMIAVFFGIPMGSWGLVVGPPGADRLGSALLLVVSVLGGWIGLKSLDARIARRARPSDD